MRTVRAHGVGKWTAAWGVVLALALGVGSSGCGPGEVKAPNPTRQLDERRAIEIIRRAVKNEGVEPAPGRDEQISGNGKTLHIDVGVSGKSYGISYVTTDDAAQLGDAIPAPNKNDEKLKLVRAGSDGETHVVLLYQQNYLYDDLSGESHEQTTITCERALMRDVQDFITHARSQKYK